MSPASAASGPVGEAIRDLAYWNRILNSDKAPSSTPPSSSTLLSANRPVAQMKRRPSRWASARAASKSAVAEGDPAPAGEKGVDLTQQSSEFRYSQVDNGEGSSSSTDAGALRDGTYSPIPDRNLPEAFEWMKMENEILREQVLARPRGGQSMPNVEDLNIANAKIASLEEFVKVLEAVAAAKNLAEYEESAKHCPLNSYSEEFLLHKLNSISDLQVKADRRVRYLEGCMMGMTEEKEEMIAEHSAEVAKLLLAYENKVVDLSIAEDKISSLEEAAKITESSPAVADNLPTDDFALERPNQDKAMNNLSVSSEGIVSPLDPTVRVPRSQRNSAETHKLNGTIKRPSRHRKAKPIPIVETAIEEENSNVWESCSDDVETAVGEEKDNVFDLGADENLPTAKSSTRLGTNLIIIALLVLYGVALTIIHGPVFYLRAAFLAAWISSYIATARIFIKSPTRFTRHIIGALLVLYWVALTMIHGPAFYTSASILVTGIPSYIATARAFFNYNPSPSADVAQPFNTMTPAGVIGALVTGIPGYIAIARAFFNLYIPDSYNSSSFAQPVNTITPESVIGDLLGWNHESAGPTWNIYESSAMACPSPDLLHLHMYPPVPPPVTIPEPIVTAQQVVSDLLGWSPESSAPDFVSIHGLALTSPAPAFMHLRMYPRMLIEEPTAPPVPGFLFRDWFITSVRSLNIGVFVAMLFRGVTNA